MSQDIAQTIPEIQEKVDVGWGFDFRLEEMALAMVALRALLAVAKAAGSAKDNPAWVFEMSDALTALDAAHPDWRTW